MKDMAFSLIGGLALLIYGIHLMGDGLQKVAGNRLRNILKALTKNAFVGTILGAAVTSLIQSSSATTVMVVGFVNARLMTLVQSIGVIFGANIGTTITAQIIAFKLTDYALPIVGLGVLLFFFVKKRSWRFTGLFLIGFGILFLGLNIMTSAMKPFTKSPTVINIFLELSKTPFLTILVGAAVTAIIQSSSATVGIVIALASTGLIDLKTSILLIWGDNIGTCATVMLASIGTGLTARRTALAHLLFNFLGVFIFLPFINQYVGIVTLLPGDIARQCANAHTLFNVANTLIFLPFVPLYARVITKIVPGKEFDLDKGPKYLEKHLLHTPSIAIEAATKEIIRMAELSRNMMNDAFSGFMSSDSKKFKDLPAQESTLDALQESITNYLMALTQQKELSYDESVKIPALLHSVNDLERIGDHAENLMELAMRKIDSDLPFTSHALQELTDMIAEINEMIDRAIRALNSNSSEEAKVVLELEDKVNEMTEILRSNHIKRLSEGQCKVMSGIVFLDMVSNFEKIGDHITNVAQAVMGRLQWKTML